MNKQKKLGGILLLSGAVVFAYAVLCLFSAWKTASQGIGIIGGADAPTAVFLMNQSVFRPYFIAAAIGLVLVIAGIILRTRKSK